MWTRGVIVTMMTALEHLLQVRELLVRGLKAVIVERMNTHALYGDNSVTTGCKVQLFVQRGGSVCSVIRTRQHLGSHPVPFGFTQEEKICPLTLHFHKLEEKEVCNSSRM